MAYDPQLETRVDAIVAAQGWPLTKRSMFGSMSYRAGDKLCFTVRDDGIMFRAEPAKLQRLRLGQGIGPAVMGERTMKNWWQTSADVIKDDAALAYLLAFAHKNS